MLKSALFCYVSTSIAIKYQFCFYSNKTI